MKLKRFKNNQTKRKMLGLVGGKQRNLQKTRKQGLNKINKKNCKSFIKQLIKNHKVLIFSKTYCSYCDSIKRFLKTKYSGKIKNVELNKKSSSEEKIYINCLYEMTGEKKVPQIFYKGKHIGGHDDTIVAYNAGDLKF